MNVNGEFFLLMILDIDHKIVFKPATGIIEHGNDNLLCLFFMQHS